MSKLDKKTLRQWKDKLREGVFGSVGIEIRQDRQGTYINILRFLNGEMCEEKHMKHQGHLAPKIFFQEFMKVNADQCLEDAPEEVLNDLIDPSGKLHKYIHDLFVHVYFRVEYARILGGIENWDSVKEILDSVADSQKKIVVEAEEVKE